MRKNYPDTYSEGEVAILTELAVLRTTVAIHAPCSGLQKLTNHFWTTLVIAVLSLIPIAVATISKGGN